MNPSTTGVGLDQLPQAAIDVLPVAVFVTAVPSGIIIRFNQRAVDLCGGRRLPSDRLGSHLRAAGSSPDRTSRISSALETGQRLLDVAAVLHVGDVEIPVSVSTEPISAEGGPVAAITTCQPMASWQDAPAALRLSEQRLAMALTAGRLGTWEFDLDTRVLTSSPQCKANHGLGPDDDLQLESTFIPAIDPEYRGTFRNVIEQAIDDRASFEMEVPHRWPDGTRHWLLVAGRVIDPSCMAGVSRDVTERRRIEEALRESEHRYKQIVETANEGIWTLDDGARITFANARMAALIGYTSADLVGRHKWDFMFPEDMAAMRRLFEQRREGTAGEVIDIRFRHRDGREVWTLMACRPRHDAAGQFIGTLDLFTNITARRRAEQALRESEERFRTLADNISQLAWMADETGWIFWYNRRWFDYTGCTLEEMQGWGWQKAHHPDHVRAVADKIRRCFETGEVWEDTFPLRARDGSYRWFLSRAVPIHDGHERIVRWFGTNTDVTDQRRTEEALIAADRSKDEFLAVLAHELRNPIAPIVTAIGLLQLKGPPEPGFRKLTDTIQRQTMQLSALVEDLLDVGRIITGKLRLERAQTELGPIVTQAVETCLPHIERRRHTVRVVLADVPIIVSVDRARMVQVVCNLLNNAAKFMQEGGAIEVTVAERERRAIINVKDAGIGLTPEMLKRIFQRFVQVDSSPNRTHGGLGIGLALVKAIVDLHGGSVEPRSEGLGRGSEFTVVLPVADGTSGSDAAA